MQAGPSSLKSEPSIPYASSPLAEPAGLNVPEGQINQWTTALLFSALVSLGLLAISFALFTPSYELNDDAIISLVASGLAFGRAPDCHINMFNHIFVGMALSKLYASNQHIPWYGIYLSVCNFLATTVICFCFIWRKPLKLALSCFLLFFVCAVLHVAVFVGYTTCSSLLCLSALFLLVRLSESETKSWAGHSCVVALMVFASLVRVEPIQLFSVLGTLLFLTGKVSIPKQLAAALLAIGISFGSAMGLHELSKHIYESDKGWRNFLLVEKASHPFTNYGYAKPVKQEDPSVKLANWSEVDGEMLSSWNYLDTEVFSLSNFQNVYARIASSSKGMPVFSKLQALGVILSDGSLMPMALICGISLLFMSRVRRRNFSFFLLGNFCLLVLMAVFLKVVPRVYYPIFCLATLLAIWELANCRLFSTSNTLPESDANGFLTWLSQRSRAGSIAFVLPLSLLLLLGFSLFIDKNFVVPKRTVLNLHVKLLDAIARLKPSKSDLYLAWTFPYEGIMPFDDLTTYFANLTICPVNWLCQSPVVNDVTQRFGLAKLLQDLDNPHLFFISIRGYNDILARYLHKHYDLDFKYENLGSFAPFGGLHPEFPVVQSEIWRWARGKMPEGGWTCKPSNADKVLTLFPSQSYNWTYSQFALAPKDKRSIYSKIAGLISPEEGPSPCMNCSGKSDGGDRKFQSSERLPTFSQFGRLAINPRDYTHFFIDIQVPDKVTVNRKVSIDLNLNSAHPRHFFIPLQLDGNMHHYEFALADLGFAKNEPITQMNVYPVFLREPGEKSSFTIKSFGFAHDKGKSNSLAAVAKASD